LEIHLDAPFVLYHGVGHAVPAIHAAVTRQRLDGTPDKVKNEGGGV
jgi:hypothetical protein